MKQFFETYNGNEKLSALLRELSWTNHCIIIAQYKSPEEKMFYLQTAARARWSSRELESQIGKRAFERTILAEQKLSPVMRELPQDVSGIFRDSYMLDFIDLPEPYREKDLREVPKSCLSLKPLLEKDIFLPEKKTFLPEKIIFLP